MIKYIDLTGQRFGKLLVKKMVRIPHKQNIHWECLCDCGEQTIVAGNALRSNRSTSCGCNINQSHILKFKKENPKASESEIIKERIKAHTKSVGECLEWQATLSANGYGVFPHKGKTMNASRAAWIAEYGEIPKGLCVIHSCDNRKCCKIKHLRLSSHAGNTFDMIAKGRDNWETTRIFPIGTRERVWELRQSGKMYREIAHEMGLKIDQVKSLLQNQKRHLRKK